MRAIAWPMALRLQPNGRRNTLSLGTYPDTRLSLARKKAEEARNLVSAGTDPSDARKEARSESALRRAAKQRVSDGLPPIYSFEAVAREWHMKNAPTWALSHSSKIIRRLEQDVFPDRLESGECHSPDRVVDLAQTRRRSRGYRDDAPCAAELRASVSLCRGNRPRRERPEPRPSRRPDTMEA